MSKKTVIVGATPNPSRYAFLAAQRLTDHDHEIVPVGLKKGTVQGKNILDIRQKPAIDQVDTITLYIRAEHQKEWYNYFLSLKPKRIIFNPGTENEELEKLAEQNGIEALEACTLVMVGTGQY
jgi:predicted CoA-binding protein